MEGREGGREGERQRERERETDRQTDRQTDRGEDSVHSLAESIPLSRLALSIFLLVLHHAPVVCAPFNACVLSLYVRKNSETQKAFWSERERERQTDRKIDR